MGFSSKQLMESLSTLEYNKLMEWFCGQTGLLDQKLGLIYYTGDVVRGINFTRYKTYARLSGGI